MSSGGKARIVHNLRMEGHKSPNQVRARFRPKRDPRGWEAFLIRFLTGLVIAFVGTLLLGIAWLVYESTLDRKAPKNRVTSAGIFAVAGGYLVYLGLRKMVKQPDPFLPAMSEFEQLRVGNAVGFLILAGAHGIVKPLTSGYLGPLISFAVYSAGLYAAGFLVVLVHEMGHYLAALAFGRQPVEFSVGDGRKLWEGKRGDLQMTWRLLPMFGHVAVDDDRSWSRVGIVCFAAAGPCATLLLGVVLWFFGPDRIGPILAGPLRDLAMSLRLVTLSTIVFSTACSLLPARYNFGNRIVPSDGILILSGLFPLRNWG
jgi:Peptidase family M50